MVRERRALKALDFSGKTFRDYAPDSVEGRNRRILQQLENPPEDFDARQALLDRIPSYFFRNYYYYFAPLKQYIKEILGDEIPDEKLKRAAQILRDEKIVPSREVIICDHSRGNNQSVVFRVLASDYERGLAERKVS